MIGVSEEQEDDAGDVCASAAVVSVAGFAVCLSPALLGRDSDEKRVGEGPFAWPMARLFVCLFV